MPRSGSLDLDIFELAPYLRAMTTQNPPSAAVLADDFVMPFQTEQSGVTGRLIRLGGAVDTVLTRHGYPETVGAALGEALVLTALSGSALKFDGRLILQTKTDGPLGFIVANYDVPGKLRAYAKFDGDALGRRDGERADDVQRRLIGTGYLALTIDPGQDMDRYQGIVALDGMTLTEATLGYFRQSEQLPTFIRIAVARHFADGRWTWRAGGLMIQRVAKGGGTERPDLSDEARDQSLDGEHNEDWTRARMLAETVEDHELLDPTLDPHRLLYRLFHEEGVRAHAAQPLEAECRCSRERITSVLGTFSPIELADMREADGAVAVTCEFCSTVYRFQPETLGQP